jgi:ribonucleoside-diphosphate reductase alpha chain
MANDLLTTYKYGWKTSYYQNTYDIKKDEETSSTEMLDNLINDIMSGNEAECDACNV